MAFYVYMLQCADGSYYTGHTDHLEKRLAQHQTRSFPGCYTANRLPVALVFQQAYATREEALGSEQKIKGWSRRKKKAMIRGDWQEVSRLARNTRTKNPVHPKSLEGHGSEPDHQDCANHPSTLLRVNGEYTHD